MPGFLIPTLINYIRGLSPAAPVGGASGGGGGASTSGGGGGTPRKAIYVGRVTDGGVAGSARAFVRFRIVDLPGAVTSARLEWLYLKKSNPTDNVLLIDIADFATLDPADWGLTERATISSSAITPATTENKKLNIDVTTRYNQAKTDGLSHFALKLQYGSESESVGPGRWYLVGGTGKWTPELVLTVTAGQDMRVELRATAVAVDLAHADALGRRAAVITAGDGATYPPLGDDVRLGATINGLVDDSLGTYTGTPSALIVRGPDQILFLWRSPDEGAGMTAGQVSDATITLARARLADWFDTVLPLTDARDVREWVARVARAIRGIVYVDQDGREALYVEPLGGTGQAPVRLVLPWEHGALRLGPVLSADAATFPVSRVEVFYALDLLGLTPEGWIGHALIASDETDPVDAARQVQASDAEARYGIREPSDQPAASSPETGYECVPIDQPGAATGVRIRDWLWDRARARPVPAQLLEVDLPRFALGWRLLDEFDIESYAFPSAAARMLLSTTPMLGSTEPAPDAYQARRARCQVREVPRLTGESGAEFPVHVLAQVLAWDTP